MNGIQQTRYTRKNITIEMMRTQQHRKRMRRLVFSVLLFLLVTVVFLIVAFTVFFKVRTIEINGLERYTYQDIMDVFPVGTEDNLFGFVTAETEETLLRECPFIGSVEIKRIIPSKIVINITEAQPVLYLTGGNEYFVLSGELRVLGRAQTEAQLPRGLIKFETSFVKRCVVGENVSFVDTRTFDAAYQLYAYFTAYGIENSIHWVDMKNRFEITFNYQGRFDIYMGSMERASIKLQFLMGILEKLDADSAGKIDISNYKEASVLIS